MQVNNLFPVVSIYCFSEGKDKWRQDLKARLNRAQSPDVDGPNALPVGC